MNHLVNGFADEICKLAESDKPAEKKKKRMQMTITRRRRVKGQAETRPAYAFMGGATGGAIGAGLASKSGSGKKMLLSGALGLLAGGALGAKAGRKGRPELHSSHTDHLGPAETKRFLAALKRKAQERKAAQNQTKTAAFPQHERPATAYDGAGPAKSLMAQTQGASAKTGLKGQPQIPTPVTHKQAPTPMTTPNQIVNG
jgi:hypothetical protein